MTPVLFEIRDSRTRMSEAEQRAEHHRRVRVARDARRRERRGRRMVVRRSGRRWWRDYRARRVGVVRTVGSDHVEPPP